MEIKKVAIVTSTAALGSGSERARAELDLTGGIGRGKD